MSIGAPDREPGAADCGRDRFSLARLCFSLAMRLCFSSVSCGGEVLRAGSEHVVRGYTRRTENGRTPHTHPVAVNVLGVDGKIVGLPDL